MWKKIWKNDMDVITKNQGRFSDPPRFFFAHTDDAMDTADRLRAELETRGWSVAELSRRADVNADVIYKILQGRTKRPRGAVLEKLADAMGIDRLWLEFGEYANRPRTGSAASDRPARFATPVSTKNEVRPFDLDVVRERLADLAEACGFADDAKIQGLLDPACEPAITEVADAAARLDTTMAYLVGECPVSHAPLSDLLTLDASYLHILIETVLHFSDDQGLELNLRDAVTIACAAYEMTALPGQRHRGPRVAEDLAAYEAKRRRDAKVN